MKFKLEHISDLRSSRKDLEKLEVQDFGVCIYREK